jgi:hypothetical protein
MADESLRDIVDFYTATKMRRSEAGRRAEAAGLLSFETSNDDVLQLSFDGATRRRQADFGPSLPLIVKWSRREFHVGRRMPWTPAQGRWGG